jgi:hypothetical protein
VDIIIHGITKTATAINIRNWRQDETDVDEDPIRKLNDSISHDPIKEQSLLFLLIRFYYIIKLPSNFEKNDVGDSSFH